MAKGHPDYLTWAGRSGGGTDVLDHSVVGNIAGEGTGTDAAPLVVPAGYEYIIHAVHISVPDDTAMHFIYLYTDLAEYIFSSSFVTSALFDFPGVHVPAGRTIILDVSNYSPDTHYFTTIVFYTVRPV